MWDFETCQKINEFNTGHEEVTVYYDNTNQLYVYSNGDDMFAVDTRTNDKVLPELSVGIANISTIKIYDKRLYCGTKYGITYVDLLIILQCNFKIFNVSKMNYSYEINLITGSFLSFDMQSFSWDLDCELDRKIIHIHADKERLIVGTRRGILLYDPNNLQLMSCKSFYNTTTILDYSFQDSFLITSTVESTDLFKVAEWD